MPIGSLTSGTRIVRVKADQTVPEQSDLRPSPATQRTPPTIVLDEVVVAAVLGVGGAEVAHAGDPRAAVVVRLRRAGAVVDVVAVVELAPRDRVVLAHRVAARRVGALVERGEHVVRAADVAARSCSARRRSRRCRAGRAWRGGCGRRPGPGATLVVAGRRVAAPSCEPTTELPLLPSHQFQRHDAGAHVGRVVDRRRCRRRSGRTG